MVAPKDIERAVRQVRNQESFVQGLLAGALEWSIPDGVERIEDVSLPWSEEELRARGLDGRLVDGKAWQIQALRHGQPWGIFLLEFGSDAHFTARGGLYGATGTLRQVLRGLVPSRRRESHLPSWQRENLLFICAHDYRQFRFAYFKAPGGGSQIAPLASFGWNEGDTHLRTLCEHNIPALGFPEDGGADAAAWVRQWAAAFDVEAVTKRFFAEYRETFEKVEASVTGVPEGEPHRLFTQRLFNRLMFLYFIQRKGWLSFQGHKRYLRALFNAASAAGEDFLNDRLYWAFFYGLNTVGEDYALHSDARLKERRGEVPFLNGGLFDLEDEYDARYKVRVPYDAFAAVLDLFECYNFTVTESTPFDIEVAVDPEMLGKVFEVLVTGRHETGSYYTPRPIVAFMCREALKQYLAAVVSDETAVACFVDEGDPIKLPDPEAVLNALRAVRVCDPACGSGAYLLGMMQELLRLREALFATRGLDAVTVYRRKMEIIQKNLYGVDNDVFAVSIAKLRLWLSLTVDFEGAKPPPLPNLDFKIECGDSLTGPSPQEAPGLFRRLLVKSADRLADLKGQFLQTSGAEKKTLAERIWEEEAKLRESLNDHGPGNSVDWRVAFAEVLKDGGFDIALANPPYVRQELFKDAKPTLQRNFPNVYVSTADLYVYFYARTQQILRPGGTACFISSNKWLKAGYGEPLRRFFAESTWVKSVVDFGHAKQIFQDADVFPSILAFGRPAAGAPPPAAHVCAIPREQLRLDDLTRQVAAEGFQVPRGRLGADPWTLEPPSVVALLDKIRKAGVPLKEFAGIVPLMGIKTGFNDAFLLDTVTKERLVAADPKSAALFRPYLRGQDVNRWAAEWSGLWMLALKSGGNHPWPWANTTRGPEAVFAAAYPAIHAHLVQHRDALKKRQDQGEHWWELRACAYWDKFDRPKVMYQEIQYHACYLLDRGKMLANNKVFFLTADDLYLLGLLNSPLMWWHNWRYLPHMKDEALTPVAFLLENLPIAKPTDDIRQASDVAVQRLTDLTAQGYKERQAILNRLKVVFGVERPSQKLQDVTALDEETLVAEVQKACGKKRPFSVALKKALRDEHARSVAPLRALAAEARQLERRVADLVNAAYGLPAEEVALMWRKAPPRMPGEPPGV
jgi:type I restriction-modification system DNA methylase subunit